MLEDHLQGNQEWNKIKDTPYDHYIQTAGRIGTEIWDQSRKHVANLTKPGLKANIIHAQRLGQIIRFRGPMC